MIFSKRTFGCGSALNAPGMLWSACSARKVLLSLKDFMVRNGCVGRGESSGEGGNLWCGEGQSAAGVTHSVGWKRDERCMDLEGNTTLSQSSE